MTLADQYRANLERSPAWAGVEALPSDPPTAHPVRFIAYYLPQFHRIAENDAWWGAGFTEWNNVVRGLPRFAGHYQPRLPADLGFYDLSQIDTIRAQAELAGRAGVFGWCIHDYWFAGRKLLETPLELILAHPDIPIRFCLNWANENWTRTWDGQARDVLIAQNYSPEDDRAYAASLLRAVADPRYIRIDGRPLVMLYRPGLLPDATATVLRWREAFAAAGEADPYVVMPQAFDDNDPARYGMDAAAGFPPHKLAPFLANHGPGLELLDPAFTGTVCDYAEAVRTEIGAREPHVKLMPGVCPGWDNEARRPGRGFTLAGATPARYGAWLADAANHAATIGTPDEAVVFINAWNEWGEGACLEPDRHFGRAFLAETRRVLDAVIAGQPYHAPPERAAIPDLRNSPGRRLLNRMRRRLRTAAVP